MPVIRWVKSMRIRWSSLCSTLTLLSLILFLAEEYITMGMYNAEQYMDLSECSERYYTFENEGTSIIIDKELHNKCGVFSIANNTDLSTRFDNNQRSELPFVETKCGKQVPTLLSYTHILPPDDLKDKVVPKIVHYICIDSWEFKFLHYISFLSVHRILKPNYIFIHGNALPYGTWWNQTLLDVGNVYYVRIDVPVRIQGRKARWIQHSSDVMRLQAIYDNGGIYLDTDIIVIQPFDHLRTYDMTMGRETSYGLGSGIIIARPKSPFVCVWFNVFKDYAPFPWKWAHYAVHTPHKLSQVIPGSIHVEVGTMHQPSFDVPQLLFDECIDWSHMYGVHVWWRSGKVPSSPAEINNLNSTLGEIMRFVYYGNKDLRAKKIN